MLWPKNGIMTYLFVENSDINRILLVNIVLH